MLHQESLQTVRGTRVFHPQEPGQPVEEDRLHPGGHDVRLHRPLVVVEDEDGADHTAGDHHHDAGEVGSYERRLAGGRHHATDHVHEEGERHQDRDTEGELLPRVRGGVETEDDHAGDDDARDDQIVEVIDRLPLNDELEGDIQEDFWAAGVLDAVPGGEGADELPLGVLLVAAGVRLHVLQCEVDQGLVVGPGPELETAVLLVKREPGNIHFAGGLEQSWNR